MSLRDILVTAIVFGLLPFILRQPHVGIYAWSWLSYMNPHRLTWGFAYSFPFAQLVALFALVGLLFSNTPKTLPKNGLIALWIAFIVWVSITTIFAVTDYSIIQYEKVMKIQIMTFITLLAIREREHLNGLIWVIALSIGFYGIKGGIFTLVNLGSHRVWGPPGSFIEDNNELALACLMTIPLMYYLRSQLEQPWARTALLAGMVLMAVSAFGSYSRGAMVAGAVLALYLWWHSRAKLLSAILIVGVAIGLYSFMPAEWHERMATMFTYKEDGSAMGRIYAWEMAFNAANDRLFGGGLSMWSPQMYQAYSPEPHTWQTSKAAHSIYFSILGEHGWIGLILFVSVFFLTWRYAGQVVTVASRHQSMNWMVNMAKAMRVVIIVYASGGLFYSLAYFDLPWHIVAMVVVLREICIREVSEKALDFHDELKPEINRPQFGQSPGSSGAMSLPKH